jgi:two-component system, chemotaxis family, CheB/CheR fusion protein
MRSSVELLGLELAASGNSEKDLLRLIVVEDEPIVARDLANQITALGYPVLGVAGTPVAALELTEQTRPDIVLMDIRLGYERDGISVAREIRDRWDIPPIFVTAYADDETLERAEEVKPLGYIVKPFRNPELKATLLMAAAQQRLTRASNESRAWLAAVLASIGDGVIALDSSNRITLVNPATEVLLERPAAAMLGHGFDEVIGSLDSRGVFAKAIASSMQVVLQIRDGSERTLEVSAAPVRANRGTPPGAVLVLRDVTESTIASNLIQRERDFLAGRVSTAGAELERTRDELHGLAASLLTAQEDEQRRIAREIHDDLAQRAAALEMSAGTIEWSLGQDQEAIRRQVAELRGCIRELSDGMRALSHNLHPAILEDLGLEIALRRYAEEFAQRENISILFRATSVPRSIPPAIAAGIYRIAQEALRNVSKHSGSPVASISLAHAGRHVRLTVRDRGRGFTPAQVRYGEGLGLISMEERSRTLSGKLAVMSKPGAGTLVVLRVPLTAH